MRLPIFLVILLAATIPVMAQEGDCAKEICGPFSEDPGDSCLGPDDPFCTGGGGGTIGACFDCARKSPCIGCKKVAQCCQSNGCDDLRRNGYTIIKMSLVWCKIYENTNADDGQDCRGQRCPTSSFSSTMTSTVDPSPCADCTSVVAVNLGCGDYKFTQSAFDFVRFDLNGDGVAEQTAWPARGEKIAFLVLDRDSNGQIDSGREMFVARNGDAVSTGGLGAVAVFDSVRFGGNGDGVLTKEDRMFSELRLWTDIDHDGRSHPSELTTLLEEGIEGIDLVARGEQRADSFGNRLVQSALVSMNGVSSPKAGVVSLRSRVEFEGNTVASLRARVASGSGH